jgi:2-polyprenyl-3-methyl-5-hydroxy-6-metoxy-1,4-benzoquinol methylase
MTRGQTEPFDAESYWSNRLERTFALEGVGWAGLGEPFNRWMYAVRRRVFRRVVRGRVDVARARVLDVGSGTGFYLALWQQLGAREITGADLTAFAVGELHARFPHFRVEKLDISATPLGLEGEYDAISVMDVLFHIIDDERYAQALQNLSALLAPEGVLVLTENLLHGDAVRVGHQTSRTIDDVENVLRRASLEIEVRRPLFVLMNTPVDSHSRLLQLTWSALQFCARSGLGWLIGPLCYPLELALTRVLREGPSTEIVVCRRMTG